MTSPTDTTVSTPTTVPRPAPPLVGSPAPDDLTTIRAGAGATTRAPLSPGARRVLLGVVAVAVYLVLACLAYWPVAPFDGTRTVGLTCARCSDHAQEIWFLSWAGFAWLHAHNPLLSSYLMLPGGANLAINTSMPLLGLLGLPVTALGGAVATYNVLLRLAFGLSAFSMYFLLRRYTSWWPAAFLGGLLYGFSPYMIGQGSGRLFLIFVPIPPLVIAIVDDWLVRRRRSPVRSGLLLGGAAGLQFLISQEIFTMTVVIVCVGLAALAIGHRAEVRERLPALLQGAGAALVIFGLLAGYPVWMLLAGPGHSLPHNVLSRAVYHNDLVGLISPTPNQLIDPSVLNKLGNPIFLRDFTESGVYLGLPLVVLLVALVIRFRRTGIVALAAATGVAAFVLSLGSGFELVHGVVNLPLPFVLFTHMPLLQSITPDRFALFLQLSAAVILAVGIDRLRTGGVRSPKSASGTTSTVASGGRETGSAGSAAPRKRPVLLVGLVAICLLPVLPRLPYHTAAVETPAIFSSSAVRTIPSGSRALTFPWDTAPNNDAMMWQVASGMRFKILGGYAIVPGAGRKPVSFLLPPGSRAVQHLLLEGTEYSGPEPADDSATRAAFRHLIETQSVGAVLVSRTSRGAAQVVRVASQVLGQPTTHGTIDLWVVKRA